MVKVSGKTLAAGKIEANLSGPIPAACAANGKFSAMKAKVLLSQQLSPESGSRQAGSLPHVA